MAFKRTVSTDFAKHLTNLLAKINGDEVEVTFKVISVNFMNDDEESGLFQTGVKVKISLPDDINDYLFDFECHISLDGKIIKQAEEQYEKEIDRRISEQ